MKRVKIMPNPVLRDNGTYYLWVAAPADVAKKAKGTFVTIPIGDTTTRAKINTHAKASLRTKELAEARKRFPAALAAVEAHWDSLRRGPIELSHKQALALAGEVRAAFVAVFDENPGEPQMWQDVSRRNALAQKGLVNELQVEIDDPLKTQATLEARFGGLVDAVLGKRHLSITSASRMKLLGHLSTAMNEAAAVNEAKAFGDYSDIGQTDKYPEYVEPKTQERENENGDTSKTLTDVLDQRIKDKALGKDAVPVKKGTEDKLRTVIQEFCDFRGHEAISTITTEQVDQWKRSMLDKGKLSNNTIAQRIQNLRTLVEYGRVQTFGKLFPEGNPVDLVERPEAAAVPSSEHTFRLGEARSVLLATRTKSLSDETRWLPWLCAYSGARISEPTQLRAEDIFEVGGRWFMRLTTMGGRSLKTQHSERRVPIHDDVLSEGFLKFVADKKAASKGNPKCRLFAASGQSKVRDWVRRTLKITRAELQPNHGWRHLFEDMALSAGMQDSARNYITGRTRGSSDEGYGKSEAMLPGLAVQMSLIPSYLDSED